MAMTIYKNICNKNEEGFLAEVSIGLSKCLTLPNYILTIITSQDINDYIEDFFEESEIDHVSKKNITLNNCSIIHFQHDKIIPNNTNALIIDDTLIEGQDIAFVGHLEEYTLPF